MNLIHSEIYDLQPGSSNMIKHLQKLCQAVNKSDSQWPAVKSLTWKATVRLQLIIVIQLCNIQSFYKHFTQINSTKYSAFEYMYTSHIYCFQFL